MKKQILILCPLAIELDSLIARIRHKKIEVTEERVGPLRVYSVPTLGIRLSLAGHGKTQFGIQTQFLIDTLKNLSLVICAGSAGSLTESLHPGDVVVAEKTIEHDFQMKFISRPSPVFEGDRHFLKIFSGLSPAGFACRLGIVASGDEDVVDVHRALALKNQTGAIAVAWEGAGGARACKFNNIPFIEMRAVTDASNSQSIAEFSNHIKQAMANLCDCILEVIQIECDEMKGS